MYHIFELIHHFQSGTERDTLSYLDLLGNHMVSEHMVWGERTAISNTTLHRKPCGLCKLLEAIE